MIEKVLALVLIMVYLVWSMTEKPVTSLKKLIEQETAVYSKGHTINIHYSQERLQNILMKAGEQNGWSMTAFKRNTLIAEKVGDNDSIAITVKFDKSEFSVVPKNSELESILAAALR